LSDNTPEAVVDIAPPESLVDLSEHIAEKCGDAVLSTHFDKDEMVIIAAPDKIEKVLQFLRDDIECQFKMLITICGVDYPDREKRFEVVYNLLSVKISRLLAMLKCAMTRHNNVLFMSL